WRVWQGTCAVLALDAHSVTHRGEAGLHIRLTVHHGKAFEAGTHHAVGAARRAGDRRAPRDVDTVREQRGGDAIAGAGGQGGAVEVDGEVAGIRPGEH